MAIKKASWKRDVKRSPSKKAAGPSKKSSSKTSSKKK